MRRFAMPDLDGHEYALAGMAGLFVIVKSMYLFPRFSDGNIYLYLSKQVSEGLLVYRDFFYSSPPALLYLLAAWGGVFGFTWLSFAWVPIVTSVIDALLLYLLSARWYSKLAGLTAAGLYLFSYAVLATTDFVSDVHMVVTPLLLGLVALVWKRPEIAGLLFGLAVLIKLYAAIVVVGIGAALLARRQWRDLLIIAGVSAILIFGVKGLFWWLVGDNFYNMVFASHFGSIAGLNKWAIFRFFGERDFLLLLIPASWLYFRARVSLLIFLPLLSVMVFLFLFQDVYYLYLKLIVIFLSLWAAWAVRQGEKEFSRGYVIGFVLVLVIGSSGWNMWRWQNEQAHAATIDGLDEMIIYVKQNVGSDEVVYGDFEMTPLISLMAERHLWQHMADTNHKFFQTGYFDPEERADKLRDAQVSWIMTKAIVAVGGRILAGPERILPASFYNTCRVARRFSLEKDYSHNAVLIWHCGNDGR